MLIIDILTNSCPLILASVGSLFSEYAGILAIFTEGLISFSAFLMFLFTNLTSSKLIGFFLTIFTASLLTFAFSYIIEKTKANAFIAATALNLFFQGFSSCLSSIIFKTRGVLYSELFTFSTFEYKTTSILLTTILVILSILFLFKTKYGIYIRITGSDSEVLTAKGISASNCRMISWTLSALFASIAGILLSMKISSFVSNIASGRGWMALAAVYLGRKNTIRIVISILIFCIADYLSLYIQNFIPSIPSYLLLSMPYIVILLFASLKRNQK